MEWQQRGTGWWESSSGYRICATRGAQGWRYSAFAPPVGSEAIEGRLKVHYCIGEPVPQARAFIGCADDPEGARAMCRDHEQRQANGTAQTRF
jgi:hypothetical protein